MLCITYMIILHSQLAPNAGVNNYRQCLILSLRGITVIMTSVCIHIRDFSWQLFFCYGVQIIYFYPPPLLQVVVVNHCFTSFFGLFSDIVIRYDKNVVVNWWDEWCTDNDVRVRVIGHGGSLRALSLLQKEFGDMLGSVCNLALSGALGVNSFFPPNCSITLWRPESSDNRVLHNI